MQKFLSKISNLEVLRVKFSVFPYTAPNIIIILRRLRRILIFDRSGKTLKSVSDFDPLKNLLDRF